MKVVVADSEMQFTAGGSNDMWGERGGSTSCVAAGLVVDGGGEISD